LQPRNPRPNGVILFLENPDNIFRINANGLTLAEKEDHMKILWRTKLAGLVE